MKYIKCVVCNTILYLLASPVFAGIDIAGNYVCSGMHQVSKELYTNVLTLTKVGEVFHFKWLGNKGSQFRGTGFLIKNSKNHLVAEFRNVKDPNMTGVIVFQIEPDGNFNATYVIADGKEIGTEICKKQT